MNYLDNVECYVTHKWSKEIKASSWWYFLRFDEFLKCLNYYCYGIRVLKVRFLSRIMCCMNSLCIINECSFLVNAALFYWKDFPIYFDGNIRYYALLLIIIKKSILVRFVAYNLLMLIIDLVLLQLTLNVIHCKLIISGP